MDKLKPNSRLMSFPRTNIRRFDDTGIACSDRRCWGPSFRSTASRRCEKVAIWHSLLGSRASSIPGSADRLIALGFHPVEARPSIFSMSPCSNALVNEEAGLASSKSMWDTVLPDCRSLEFETIRVWVPADLCRVVVRDASNSSMRRAPIACAVAGS